MRKFFERLPIRAILIIEEVMANMGRGTIAGVISFEIIEIGIEHLLLEEFVTVRHHDGMRLCHKKIIVHRQQTLFGAVELDIRQIETPQAIDFAAPRIGFAVARRVVTEACVF